MVQKPALIGEEPLREVAAPFWPQQIDTVSEEMLLEDIKLGIHDPQQHTCLFRQLAQSPDKTKSGQGREQEHDNCQPPGAFQWNNGRQGPCRSIQKSSKQRPCEY